MQFKLPIRDVDFSKTMYKLEEELQNSSEPSVWFDWECNSGKLWIKLDNAENWQQAFERDPMACYTLMEVLKSTVKNEK